MSIQNCNACGAQFEGEFCPACGTSVNSAPGARFDPYRDAGGDGYSGGRREPQTDMGGIPLEYQPVSTLGFIGIMLLMWVPLVNLICGIVWAFGGCKKINMRNYARAWLLVGIITTVISFLLAIAVMNYATGVLPGELGAALRIMGDA